MRILNKNTWPYKLEWKVLGPGLDHTERLTWAQEQFGKTQVNCTEHHIYFKNNLDMTFFNLRWAGK
jgi:hypothetical protein